MRDGPVRAARWVERWWRGEAGAPGRIADVALAPAELVYRTAVRRIDAAYASGRRRAERVGVPVVSVGNLAVGGAGKTPVTRWLVAELRRRGTRPAVLHGGYADDEPALHRGWHPDVPVVVGRDRVAGARQAIAAGATVLVLDDGFQHRRLARDLDIVLVAAESWHPHPRLLPRGPWREPPSALGRAQVVAVTRKVAPAEAARRVAEEAVAHAPHAATLRLYLAPAGWRGPDGAERGGPPPGAAVAVAGIASPELFVANAEAAGANVTGALVFPDHFDYHDGAVRRIREAARGRPVVTTAKDAVKLAARAPDLAIWVLEQKVAAEAGGAALAELLDELVA